MALALRYLVSAIVLLCLQIQIDRGLSFEDAQAKLDADGLPGEGFYKTKRVSWALYAFCVKY